MLWKSQNIPLRKILILIKELSSHSCNQCQCQLCELLYSTLAISAGSKWFEVGSDGIGCGILIFEEWARASGYRFQWEATALPLNQVVVWSLMKWPEGVRGYRFDSKFWVDFQLTQQKLEWRGLHFSFRNTFCLLKFEGRRDIYEGEFII